MNNVPPRRGRSRRFVTGIVLLLVGGVMLAANLGFDIPVGIQRYWPLLLIVPGIVGVIVPGPYLDRSGGIWLLATGLYCFASVFGLFDLDWMSAWPIFIIAAGCDVIFARHRRHRNGDMSAGSEG